MEKKFMQMIKHSDLYFLLHNFGVPFIPFELGIFQKNSSEGKKDKVKSTHIGLY